MKKLLVSLLALTLILVGCGSNNEKNDDAIQIGIIQLVQHGSLDDARKGFIKALEDAGYAIGTDIVIDYQNGSGEQSTMTTIAQKFVNDEKDLVLAIATDAAMIQYIP